MLFFWSFDSCLVACPLSPIANDPIIKTRKRRRTVATAVVGLRRRVHPTPPQKVFAVAERSSASRYVCTCVCVFCVCMSSFSNGSKPPARALFMDIIPSPNPESGFVSKVSSRRKEKSGKKVDVVRRHRPRQESASLAKCFDQIQPTTMRGSSWFLASQSSPFSAITSKICGC